MAETQMFDGESVNGQSVPLPISRCMSEVQLGLQRTAYYNEFVNGRSARPARRAGEIERQRVMEKNGYEVFQSNSNS